MQIVLSRIDDRLIHGQVATIWSKETGCNRIIVVSDEVANDTLRKTLLVQVAPPGVKANVITIDKMIEIYNNPKYDSFKALLLFTNPADVLRIVEGGVDIKTVNIGGMSFKEGKKQITSAVSVDDKDIEAFKKLNEKGIELEIRKVPTDPKVDIMTKL
ncbi:MAG: mannose/fructose/sorbose PTS transporter subunit IIB [Caloramator sp.]|nr:mannose/fructose/sorbose PTS transporter subunit IIB [Caloramator sp.]